MKITTLTVDTDDTIITTVHRNEAEAIEYLRENYDPDGDFGDDDEIVQHLCNNGLCIYIEDHPLSFSLPPGITQELQAAANTALGDSNDAEIEAWRDVAETLCGVLGIEIPDAEEDDE